MTATPRSPIAHLELPADGPVRLREIPFPAQVELRLDDPEHVERGEQGGHGEPAGVVPPGGSLPAAGRVTGDGARDMLWLGPGWYLIVDRPDAAAGLLPALRAAIGEERGSAVDVSAGRVVLELSGPHARDVLSHGCPLDLHPRVFGPGRCAQTRLAQAQVVLHATAADTYRIFVRTSFADYLVRWLLDAMTEYRVSGPPDGNLRTSGE